MAKFITLVLASTFLASAAMASTYEVGCDGIKDGNKVAFRGTLTNILDPHSGQGSLFVNDHMVASFDRQDLNLEVMELSYQAINNQGAMVEGEVSNLLKKTGPIKKLEVPDLGLKLTNIPMSCWSKKF